MKVYTDLSGPDYAKFQTKCKQLNMTEYELAKTAIKVFVNGNDHVAKTILQKVMDIVEKIESLP